jgi:hypothetical protein
MPYKNKQEEKIKKAAYYLKNRKLFQEKALKHYQENKEEVIARIRSYRKKNYEKVKLCTRLSRLRTFGLSEKEVERAREAHTNFKGFCAACGSNKAGAKGWCFDHDYEKRAFRAILCSRCNSAIGMASDSIEVLKSLVVYLEKNEI